MTFEEAIKEAIKHEGKVVSDYERLKEVRALDEFEMYCLEYHRQLAEWLKDYKRLLGAIEAIREELQGISSRNYGNGFEHGIDKALEVIEKHISGGAE